MKVILIIITATAAAIALPTFNEKHILDFGNTSDIISALCNCVVAGAAVMAFISAKNWIYQRMHDDVYKIAKELFTQDYPEIIKLCNEINYIAPNFSGKLTGDVNSLAESYTTDVENSLTTIGNNLEELKSNADAKIKILKKFNFQPIEKYSLYHKALMIELDLQIKTIRNLVLNIDNMRTAILPQQVKSSIANIKTHSSHAQRKHTRLNSIYNDMYDLRVGFMDYFKLI
ncbi:hypothetical protein QZQ56_17270 [Serratia marcescens]|uniref:hypothetical protein n=1 Tax=Serratia marcescens TaxID=615 RepID=UPI000AC364D2|nr:hypothetical protein [Serratia marcescens]MBH3113604.1 hypothetical protein [Serratia marcescens]MDP8840132.1 hypothetical protein [Serratia marcescens]BEN21883.1 hypothetical protein SMKC031_26560 [Serratia marcescens]HBV9082921.1 hypothetical protein [Serratia marcescens]